MLPIRRLALALVAAAVSTASAAAERTCAVATAAETVLCEQQRAQSALEALTDRYTRVWAALPADRRLAFSAGERKWLNGGRWDAHAVCVAANAGSGPAEVVAARCLADVTAAHLGALAAPL